MAKKQLNKVFSLKALKSFMSKRDIQHELTLFFLRFIALQGTSILRGYFYVSHKKEALFLGWESRKKCTFLHFATIQSESYKKLGGTCGQLCCFNPILVTWFLVGFGNGVMKILHDSLFIFHFVSPVLPCKQNIVQKITHLK